MLRHTIFLYLILLSYQCPILSRCLHHVSLGHDTNFHDYFPQQVALLITTISIHDREVKRKDTKAWLLAARAHVVVMYVSNITAFFFGRAEVVPNIPV